MHNAPIPNQNVFTSNRKITVLPPQLSPRPKNTTRIVKYKSTSASHEKNPSSCPSKKNNELNGIDYKSSFVRKQLSFQRQKGSKNKVPLSLINVNKFEKEGQNVPKLLSQSSERQSNFLKANNKYKSYLVGYLNSKAKSNSSYQSLSRLQQTNNCLSEFRKHLSKIIKFGYRTRQGILITNPNKPNQDSYVIVSNPKDDNYLFAIADGHGFQGHHVSQLAAKRLQQYFVSKNRKEKSETFLTKAFNQIQEQLYAVKDFDTNNSGSTMVSVLLQKSKRQVTCANVGDSRAILARQVSKSSWEIVHLSEDHKPSLQKEKRRILRKGGEIRCARDEEGKPIGPQRVWISNKNFQGLAMSRSLGDNVSKPVGVIHDPQIVQIPIQQTDRFILLASDGIWEFISNLQILQLIIPFYKQGKLEQCCDSILKLAYQRWTAEDSNIVDDITLILIYLNPL